MARAIKNLFNCAPRGDVWARKCFSSFLSRIAIKQTEVIFTPQAADTLCGTYSRKSTAGRQGRKLRVHCRSRESITEVDKDSFESSERKY